MKSIKLSLLLVALTIMVFSCKKETETASPTKSSPPTKTEILAEGKWQNSTTLATPPIDINGKMVTNITGYIKACELDNYYTFTKNKTYALNNGATKCDTNEEDVKAKGTWQITADDKYFILTTDSGSDSLLLDFFSKDSLVYKTNARYDGKLHELKRTLVKK